MLEKGVEDPFARYVKASGCLCIKLNITGLRGIPDRLVIGPQQFVAFFELKRPKGGVLSAMQIWFHNKLREFGFTVVCASTREDAIYEFNRLVGEHYIEEDM